MRVVQVGIDKPRKVLIQENKQFISQFYKKYNKESRMQIWKKYMYYFYLQNVNWKSFFMRINSKSRSNRQNIYVQWGINFYYFSLQWNQCQKSICHNSHNYNLAWMDCDCSQSILSRTHILYQRIPVHMQLGHDTIFTTEPLLVKQHVGRLKTTFYLQNQVLKFGVQNEQTGRCYPMFQTVKNVKKSRQSNRKLNVQIRLNQKSEKIYLLIDGEQFQIKQSSFKKCSSYLYIQYCCCASQQHLEYSWYDDNHDYSEKSQSQTQSDNQIEQQFRQQESQKMIKMKQEKKYLQINTLNQNSDKNTKQNKKLSFYEKNRNNPFSFLQFQQDQQNDFEIKQ